MTADHWGFVLAAYGIAAVALGVYWRHLCRRDRELTLLASPVINRAEQRSQAAPEAGRPRPTPASRTPLP
jgi:hypothetical protein